MRDPFYVGQFAAMERYTLTAPLLDMNYELCEAKRQLATSEYGHEKRYWEGHIAWIVGYLLRFL